MSNTATLLKTSLGVFVAAITATLALSAPAQNAAAQRSEDMSHSTAASVSENLSARQRAIVPVAAFAASGDIKRLGEALNRGLDAGLTISDAREVLVQLYAYAGFPRSLNALTELKDVVESRRARGIEDAPGSEPSHPALKGDALLAAGTANQTKLSGSPVEGPLFEFVPVANEYLRTHLFGDIFERDNLDWQSREVATVSMLSAIAGAEAQLQAHMRMSMNTGLSTEQLRQLTQVLAAQVGEETAQRASLALERHLGGS